MEEAALLERQAIKAALKGAWEQAIEVNQKILKLNPKNMAALNRLGQAFWKAGNLDAAKKSYQKVLKVDRYNTIATKNLKRLGDQKKAAPQKGNPKQVAFLEEPGRTKIVKLVRLAGPAALSELNSGDELLLEPKRHIISVTTPDKTYLGSLPDDLSHRLLRFLKGGNQYQVLVKSVERQTLEVFIREEKRAKKFANVPSFTSPLIFANNLPQG